MTIYEIHEKTGIDAGTILGLATLLEMKGFIKQISGNKFILNK